MGHCVTSLGFFVFFLVLYCTCARQASPMHYKLLLPTVPVSNNNVHFDEDLAAFWSEQETLLLPIPLPGPRGHFAARLEPRPPNLTICSLLCFELTRSPQTNDTLSFRLAFPGCYFGNPDPLEGEQNKAPPPPSGSLS